MKWRATQSGSALKKSTEVEKVAVEIQLKIQK